MRIKKKRSDKFKSEIESQTNFLSIKRILILTVGIIIINLPILEIVINFIEFNYIFYHNLSTLLMIILGIYSCVLFIIIFKNIPPKRKIPINDRSNEKKISN